MRRDLFLALCVSVFYRWETVKTKFEHLIIETTSLKAVPSMAKFLLNTSRKTLGKDRDWSSTCRKKSNESLKKSTLLHSSNWLPEHLTSIADKKSRLVSVEGRPLDG